MKRFGIPIAVPLLFVPLYVVRADDAEKEKKPLKIEVQVQPGARLLGAVQLGRAAGPLNLLRIAKVQEELRLDDQQKAQVQSAFDELNEQRRETFAELRGLQGEERQKKAAEVTKLIQQQTEDATRAVRGVLKPEQSKRLDQILLQQQGLRALSDPKVSGELTLTDEQKQKIADVEADSQTKRQELLQKVRAGELARAELRGKLEELTKETETKTIDVLTDEQQKQFEQMKGEKFELPVRRLRAVPVPIPARPAQPLRIQEAS